ncbi:MAG: translation initiation factor IF-5A [Candidatus Kariarchaeaceae archaeon]|jgi:translation initiation factor 5A
MSEGDTRPEKATAIRVGNHLVYEGGVYKVLSTDTSKSGKHGHAKVRMSIQHIVTGNKKSLVMPGDDKVRIPLIEKRIGQVLAVNPDSLQLMDKETYEVFETTLPDYDDIGGTLDSGDEVDIWKVLGVNIIRQKRSLSE